MYIMDGILWYYIVPVQTLKGVQFAHFKSSAHPAKKAVEQLPGNATLHFPVGIPLLLTYLLR